MTDRIEQFYILFIRFLAPPRRRIRRRGFINGLQQVPRQGRELGDDVVGRFDELGTLADELVAAAGQRIMNGPRYREHLPPLLRSQPRRDQRATATGGLDDEGAEAEPADQAIALREERPVGRCAQRKLADQCAVPGNIPGELTIRGRVNAIDAVTEKGDGRTTRRQRSAVGGRVDALREAADDAEARRAEVPGELEGVPRAAGRRVAAADDRERGQVQNLRVAIDKKLCGRTRDSRQQLRIRVVPRPDKVVVVIL